MPDSITLYDHCGVGRQVSTAEEVEEILDQFHEAFLEIDEIYQSSAGITPVQIIKARALIDCWNANSSTLAAWTKAQKEHEIAQIREAIKDVVEQGIARRRG